jgi:hypothetical protein
VDIAVSTLIYALDANREKTGNAVSLFANSNAKVIEKKQDIIVKNKITVRLFSITYSSPMAFLNILAA